MRLEPGGSACTRWLDNGYYGNFLQSLNFMYVMVMIEK